MICFEMQTPTINETPISIYYNIDNLPGEVNDGEISQIRNVLLSIKNNGFAELRPSPFAKSELILDGLRNRREGWNGGNVDAPNPESIERARKWLRSMYADAVTSNTTWIDPHVSSNEDGNVTFEWWNGDKKLTVYVSPEESWYIKVWGADVVNEMSDGTAESMEERQDAWQWLMA